MRFTTIAAIAVCAVSTSVVAGADTRGRGKAATASPITVTGCLEHDDASYRLTETSGEHAPKARSWKTGFVMRRNTSLDIVDPAKKLKLRDHAGHRVAITGSVRGGEMRAQSMRHLAASCGQ